MGDSSNMERFANIVETKKGIIKKVKGKARDDENRKYCAVNLRNTDTVEFRFFKGVGSYQDFMRNMEFIDSLIGFSKVSGMNIWPHTLARYVKTKRKRYPVLSATFDSMFGKDV
jgi:hypothetical protein